MLLQDAHDALRGAPIAEGEVGALWAVCRNYLLDDSEDCSEILSEDVVRAVCDDYRSLGPFASRHQGTGTPHHTSR